jgi:hypothetical protein
VVETDAGGVGRGCRSEDAEQPLDRLGALLAALPVARLLGQLREQMPESPPSEGQDLGVVAFLGRRRV